MISLQFVFDARGPVLLGHVLGHQLFDAIDELVLFETVFADFAPRRQNLFQLFNLKKQVNSAALELITSQFLP